ncbi:MAG: FAD-dependent oxidoreductase [Eubacteriales bacterium]|nr:FAD-dependent oxidoreductase [Eubacteriales bacterium]
MSKSIWSEGQKLPAFGKLQGKVTTDVLIIGGGLCGVLCAYMLRNAGVDCLLVEADTVGGGITCNTTAKITSQHGLIYDKLVRSRGNEVAAGYLRANQEALAKYRELAGMVECEFEERDAFVYTLSDREKIKREVNTVNELGFPASFVEEVPLPLDVKGAIRFPDQAQFHPLKFLNGIVTGLPICEHTFIRDLAPHKAWSDSGEITADKIIVATHFPFLNKHGGYFLKLYQHRSYVIALEQAPDVQGMYLDEAQTGLSFRNYRNLLLVGGGSHRTGKQGGNWQELRNFVNLHYPAAREVTAWATQDCMSLDGIPYIGQYSVRTPDLYVASGFNKWGMTSSMVAAMLLRDLVTGTENPWERIFSPGRSIWKPQLFLNGAEAVTNLLTPAKRRCPHMGCALKWNPHERTWDCPCHGSRFTGDGKIIDNPATGNAKFD